MPPGKLVADLLSSRPGRILWRSLLFLVAIVCAGCGFWLQIDMIPTDDFHDVRSAIEPDLEELFERAKEEFARGSTWYTYRSDIARQSSEERYGVSSLEILQYGMEEGPIYEVLFAFTARGRGFSHGYYYTPSGRMPRVAPMYGVICSKHMENGWYAFNTSDSDNPPKPENCPEDVQYQ